MIYEFISGVWVYIIITVFALILLALITKNGTQ